MVSVVGLHNRETPCSLLPGSQKDEGVQTHFGPLPFEQVHCQQDMLTIRQLLKLVKQGIWFTTIDLKDTYFYVNVALKHRKFLGFALQRVQQAPVRLYAACTPFSELSTATCPLVT